MEGYFEQYPYKRFYEIIPGAISWTVILVPVVLSIFIPEAVAYFIILFDFYWLVKAFIMGGHLISGYLHMRIAEQTPWLSWCKSLSKGIEKHMKMLRGKQKKGSMIYRRRISDDLKSLQYFREHKNKLFSWGEIYHALILPTYEEPFSVLDASISAARDSDYPNNKIIIILALEERAGREKRLKVANRLKAKFGDIFREFLIVFHPDGIVGELKGKGANSAWAGKEFRKWVDKRKIPYENIIVSCFDCDTRPSKKYFSALTYKYLINPDRIHRSYQPIPVYSNNIWQVPIINRLVAFGASFWQMIESTRPYRMVNFSSQAMSFQTVIDIDYWDRTIVSEDSKQYYRALFHYHGNHEVVPVFTPVYMDAVTGPTFWQTLVAQYKQKRRWAWGIEHFPYLMREIVKHKEIPLYDRLKQVGRVLDGHVSWATASLLIAFGGIFPLLLNPEFRSTVLAYSMPVMARNLLTVTWIGLFISAVISILLLPPRPKNYPAYKTVFMALQWVLVPISAIFFGSIPAIEAQTRLMTRKYLGFWVTPKGKED